MKVLSARTVPEEMVAALATIDRLGGPTLITKMVRLFGTGSRERIAALDAAFVANDRAEIARLAHGLVGSAAQIGAESLRRIALTTEQTATTSDARSLRASIDEVRLEFDRAMALLTVFLDGDGAIAIR